MRSNISIVQSYLNNERPFVKVGYTGDINKYIIRKEGETWTDANGKNWIHQNGVTKTVTRVMDIIREEINQKCTECKCEIRWGSRHDSKIHAKTGMCMDCLIKMETQLRVTGKYKAYEKKKMLENEKSQIEESLKYLTESKQYIKEHKVFTYVNSNGLTEEWSGHSIKNLMATIQKDLVKGRKELKRVITELNVVTDELATTNTTG